MVELPFIAQFALLFFVAVLGGIVATLAKQPAFVGYILAGTVFGPHFLGFIHDTPEMAGIAEIGIILLLFGIGLDFSFTRLITYGRVAVVGGIIQIVATTFAGSFLLFFGFGLLESVFIGALTAFSSTAIVVKVLQSLRKLNTTEGRIVTSYLLVQDLAVIPMLLIFPALKEGDFLGLLLGLVKPAVLIALTLAVGLKVVPRLVVNLTRKNHELFIILVFFLAMSVAYLTSQFGLSLGLGAFLAGLLISATPTAYQAFNDIKSLREIFIVIFFVSIGLLINPIALLQNPLLILFLLLISILAKFISTSYWILRFGYSAKVAFLTSLSLLSIGEFSFILGKLGVDKGIISPDVYQSVLGASLLSILLTQPALKYSTPLYNRLRSILEYRWPSLAKNIFSPKSFYIATEEPLENHVVLCGLGQTGKYISQSLHHWKIPQIVVDFDLSALDYAEDRGIPAIYGEASDDQILSHLALDKAKALVVSHSDYESAHVLIKKAKDVNPDLIIMARADHNVAFEKLAPLNVERLVHPKFEASLKFTERLLTHLGVEKSEADSFLSHIRFKPD